MKQNAIIKSGKSGMTIHLNPDADMADIILELTEKFDHNAKFWGSVSMILTLDGRDLTAGEEVEIVNTITSHSHIQIVSLFDGNPENDERNDLLIRRKYMELNNLTGRFHMGSIMKGDILSIEPSLIVVGDVYEGACVESSGSIVVLGELSGTARAGCCGNADAVVAAMVMATEDVTVNGISLAASGIRHKNVNYPEAVYLENGHLVLRPLKKSLLRAINHKKCW